METLVFTRLTLFVNSMNRLNYFNRVKLQIKQIKQNHLRLLEFLMVLDHCVCCCNIFNIQYLNVVGPIIGGFLSSPVEQYPFIFSNMPQFVTSFFALFPFLLPNLIVFCMGFIALILGYFNLTESHPRILKQKQEKQQLEIELAEEQSEQINTKIPNKQDKPWQKFVNNEIIRTRAPLICCFIYGFVGLVQVMIDESMVFFF